MIGKGFVSRPELPSPFPVAEKYWVCPVTNMKVPQGFEANMLYREKVLRKAETDSVTRQDLLAVCRRSPIFWIDVFGFTYHQFEIDPDSGTSHPSEQPWHPFILWPIQRKLIDALHESFLAGKDILISKARDMGASWCCLAYLHWLWLFRPDTQIRELSRVEDYVDSASSKSLMWKHDALNRHLPLWMRPPGVDERGKGNRTLLRMHNELNGSTISGESTNKHALSGDRCQVLLLDEFAKVDSGNLVRTATADAAPCRIVNSTTTGVGTAFAEWKNSGLIRVFDLPFYEHPVKGKGRMVIQDDTTKEFFITSPWLEEQRKRRTDKEISQEILACDAQAGDMLFSHEVLNRHAALYCRPPKERYNVRLKDRVPNADVPMLFRKKDLTSVSLSRAKEGELLVWAPLTNGRLDQSKTYIIGMDISRGQGGEGTTESVASIKCKQTGEIVAKWCSRTTPPYEAARVMAALCLWVGGGAPQKLPFVVYENNGPGWDFGRVFIQEMKYPHFYRDEQIGEVTDKTTKKMGFHTTRQRKELLLRAYERALREGKVINRDQRSIDQAKTYITYPSGGCGPAELVDKSRAEYLGHGDRTMADALTVLDKNVLKPRPDKEAGRGALDSWGGRFEAWKSEQRKINGWQRQFSFR